MKDLVIMQDQEAVTTSLNVAENFGKEHAKVIRTIESKIDSSQNRREYQKMFTEGSYKDRSGKSNKMYFMNRDGFTFIAFGFTGKRADEFKLKYIDAFNQMEDHIKNGLPETPEEKLLLTMDVTNRTVKRVTKVENRVTDLEENQTLAPGEYNYITI